MSEYSQTKNNGPGSYYHVSVHDGDEGRIFLDEADYGFFILLLEKLLLKNDLIEVIAYCLLSDRFDLLLRPSGKVDITGLSNNIMTKYNRYYYGKYQIKNLLLDDNSTIAEVLADDLLAVSRQIHVQTNDWIDYPHSSIRTYLYDDVPIWLNKTYLSERYGSTTKYLDYLQKPV